MALTDESPQIEKLKSALDWYAEKAIKLNAYVLAMDERKMLEVMQQLANDNGEIARKAIKA